MYMSKNIRRVILLWIPVLILPVSIYFIIKNEFTFVFGIITFGFVLDSLIDLKLKGLSEKEDERYLLIKQKGNELSYLFTYSIIIILIIIHFFFITLEANFILMFLLITAYTSSAVGSFYLSFKY